MALTQFVCPTCNREIPGNLAPDPPQYRRVGRMKVTREAVESRLLLHRQTVDGLLGKIIARADADTAAELTELVNWIRADGDRVIRDLFELREWQPRHGKARPPDPVSID